MRLEFGEFPQYVCDFLPKSKLLECVVSPTGYVNVGRSKGIRFFHFCIRFCQKVPASEVGDLVPPPPPTGNPGSATGEDNELDSSEHSSDGSTN